MTKEIYKEKDLKRLSEKIIFLLSKKIKDGKATILFLEGEIGSGKTTFTKFLAQQLGVKNSATSPTFTIMNIYKTKNENWDKIFHIDAYRLSGAKDISILKIEQDLKERKNLFIFEWASNVSNLVKPDLEVKFFHQKNGENREISFD